MAARRRTPTPDPQVEALLAAAEANHAVKTRAEALEFELAAEWAAAHPGDAVEESSDGPVFEALVLFGDRPLEIAGAGAPTVSEFSITEFASAVGMSSISGRRFIGAAVETKHRLPLLWQRVMAGEVPVWKVRRITEQTHRLPFVGAAYVDRELVQIAHSCSFAQIERVAATAAAEFDNEHVEQERAATEASRHFHVALDDARHNHGYVPVSGLLDLEDALALDAAIKDCAHQLLSDHPELDLDVRRAQALGLLADQAMTGGDGAGARELVIYAHHDSRAQHDLVGIEATGSVITIEQLAEWCTQAGTKVSIRPVLDLDAELRTDSYRPTAKQCEQAILTCPTCVFPGCGRSARAADLDHIVPWSKGGATTSFNLAPLCRLHHRMKTHGDWSYSRRSRTCFVWTSPLGRTYVNDLTGKRRRTC